MNFPLKTLAAAILVAGAITLAGCTSTTGAAPAPAPSATETAAPAEDTVVPAGTVAGAAVDEEVAAKLNGSLAGDKAYKTPTGEYVFVPVDEPLPPAIVEHVTNSVIAASPNAGAIVGETMGAEVNKMMGALQAQSDATGHRIVLVSHAMSWDDASARYVPVWAVSQPAKAASFGSKAEAIAHATTWINGDPNKTYIVIDYLG